MNIRIFMFFFFQAEDGIRDRTVTGVQTCALPISRPDAPAMRRAMLTTIGVPILMAATSAESIRSDVSMAVSRTATDLRSEERRVGKECRSWWWQNHSKRNKEKRTIRIVE